MEAEEMRMKTPRQPQEVAIHTPPSTLEDPFATPEEPRSEEMRTGREDGAGGGRRDEEREISMEAILAMMRNMQEIQKKMLERELRDKDEEKGMTGRAEFVRGQPEPPKLQPWHPVNGPIDLNDWLSLVEPVIADLTATSHERDHEDEPDGQDPS